MIPVTKPFLPPYEEYQQYLKGIWKRQWLTNNGPLVNDLESKLKNHLEVSNIQFLNNGTTALQFAIKALELTGEIITTPFSFVATTSSIVWEGCKPVFVDIDRQTLNIDPKKIEEAITSNTSAILATHVYGNPCDVLTIEKLAEKHNLKVIYDGAHAFGVKINGKSIFEFGDVSTCSLHATKLYHSIEGGLVFTKDNKLSEKLINIRNFGISGFDSFSQLGINGKNSEFHAAMGLLNLEYISQIHQKRKDISDLYDHYLKGLSFEKPKWSLGATMNYAYYVVVLESEELLLKIKRQLDLNEIFTRRYFYPSLASSLPYIEKQDFEITDDVSRRVLCLPLYYDLTKEEVILISEMMIKVQNS